MERVVYQLQRQNLDAAIEAAKAAARREGPWMDHFAELGRRWRTATQEDRPRLRLLDGGDAT